MADPWEEAAKNFKPSAQAQTPAVTGPNEDWKLWQPNAAPAMPTDPGGVAARAKYKATFGQEAAEGYPRNLPGGQGLSEIGGAMLGTGIPGVVAHPIAAATGLAGSIAARKITKMLGAPDGLADAAGIVGGLAGGLGAGRIGGALRTMPDEVAGSFPFGKALKYYNARSAANSAESATADAAAAHRASNPPRAVAPVPRAAAPDFEPTPGPLPSGRTVGPAAPQPRTPLRPPLWQGPEQPTAGPTPEFTPKPSALPSGRKVGGLANAVESGPEVGPKTTPEKLAEPFKGDEARTTAAREASAAKGQEIKSGHQDARAQKIADYIKANRYNTPDHMKLLEDNPDLWKTMGKNAGALDPSPTTIGKVKALLK